MAKTLAQFGNNKYEDIMAGISQKFLNNYVVQVRKKNLYDSLIKSN